MRDFLGSFQCARKIFVSEIFVSKPAQWFKIWMYIIGICNYKDQGVFKKGECFTNYKDIQDDTKATHAEVQHCIAYLKKAGNIATRKATRGFYIKVLKYDYYQDFKNYKDEAKATRKVIQKTHRGHTIIKNDNNYKKGKGHFMPGVGLIKEFKN